MSLLTDSYEDVTMIDRITALDDRGGVEVKWVEGAPFKAAITLDSSIQARVAEHEGVTGLYTVTTNRSINLQYHNVFRRERDKKIFRVTSDGDDNLTPKSATLDMRQVSAEEWELPKNG